MAKLIYQNNEDDFEVSITINKDADIYKLLDTFKRLAMAIGYHPDSIADGIITCSEEYTNKENENDK